MSDESQEGLSNESEPTADELKAAWDSENEQPTGEALEEPQENPAESEETPEETSEEKPSEVTGNVSSHEPIVLRKQKARLKAELDAARAELARIRAAEESSPGLPPVPVDPVTGQPLEENSVAGQVYKTLAAMAQQQKVAQEKRSEAERENVVRQQYQDLQDKLDEGSTKYADFDDVVLANDVPITNAMRDAALMLPNPEDTLYHIAKNRDELRRIGKLPPLEQAREMVKASAALLSKSQSVKTPSAPRPLAKIAHNPTAKTPSRGITENSSVSEIRAHLKGVWR